MGNSFAKLEISSLLESFKAPYSSYWIIGIFKLVNFHNFLLWLHLSFSYFVNLSSSSSSHSILMWNCLCSNFICLSSSFGLQWSLYSLTMYRPLLSITLVNSLATSHDFLLFIPCQSSTLCNIHCLLSLMLEVKALIVKEIRLSIRFATNALCIPLYCGYLMLSMVKFDFSTNLILLKITVFYYQLKTQAKSFIVKADKIIVHMFTLNFKPILHIHVSNSLRPSIYSIWLFPICWPLSLATYHIHISVCSNSANNSLPSK